MAPKDFDWTELTNKNLPQWGVEIKKKTTPLGNVLFAETVTYIGRMPENAVVLDDPKVSRSHAKITLCEGQYVLEDQQSENGLRVNGQKTLKAILKLGDTISIGDFTLTVIDHVQAQSGAKPLKAFGEEDTNERTISVQDLSQPSEAVIILKILGQPRMHKILFTEDEAARIFNDEDLTISVVFETETAVLKKSFKITNT